METPPKEYIEWPGTEAPPQLQILAKMLMRWLESGDLTYHQLVEVYNEVELQLGSD